jgi:hypothetical protein
LKAFSLQETLQSPIQKKGTEKFVRGMIQLGQASAHHFFCHQSGTAFKNLHNKEIAADGIPCNNVTAFPSLEKRALTHALLALSRHLPVT